MLERRKETEARRIGPVKIGGNSDPLLDLLAERILMDMIRSESPTDDYWFAVDTGWWIPLEGKE